MAQTSGTVAVVSSSGDPGAIVRGVRSCRSAEEIQIQGMPSPHAVTTSDDASLEAGVVGVEQILAGT